LHEHPEDVVALLEVRILMRPVDLFEDHRVDWLEQPRERSRGLAAAQDQLLVVEHLQRVGPPLEQTGEPSAHQLFTWALCCAEYDFEDHIEGNRLKSWQQRRRLVQRPACNPLLADARHQIAVAVHALAVERRP